MGGWGGRRGTGRRSVWAACALLAALATLAGGLAGCASDGKSARASSAPSPSPSQSPSASAAPSPSASAPSGPLTYVSIGDSYAAGYQPRAGQLIGQTSTSGFAYQLAKIATLHGHRLSVVNFACGGETSTGLLNQKGCFRFLQGPNSITYDAMTQAAAALDYIRKHRPQIGLVTVSIGGNDVIGCSAGNDILPCLRQRIPVLAANLKRFLAELRQATGPEVTIVGLTYPDVLLGGATFSTAEGMTLAADSVEGFRSLLNPTLKAAYQAVGAIFIDVTAATGAYLPKSRTTVLAPYGKIPVSVARVCELTYFCDLQDIHPRDSGYRFMAELIAKALPK